MNDNSLAKLRELNTKIELLKERLDYLQRRNIQNDNIKKLKEDIKRYEKESIIIKERLNLLWELKNGRKNE